MVGIIHFFFFKNNYNNTYRLRNDFLFLAAKLKIKFNRLKKNFNDHLNINTICEKSNTNLFKYHKNKIQLEWLNSINKEKLVLFKEKELLYDEIKNLFFINKKLKPTPQYVTKYYLDSIVHTVTLGNFISTELNNFFLNYKYKNAHLTLLRFINFNSTNSIEMFFNSKKYNAHLLYNTYINYHIDFFYLNYKFVNSFFFNDLKIYENLNLNKELVNESSIFLEICKENLNLINLSPKFKNNLNFWQNSRGLSMFLLEKNFNSIFNTLIL